MRRSLLEPLPQHDLAAGLLAKAADALLVGDRQTAVECMKAADYSQITQHLVRLVGKMSPEVHRSTRRPDTVPEEDRHPDRMPVRVEQRQIFERDGWRCRFCGIRVISVKARGVLVRHFPDIARWSSPYNQRHSALYALSSSLDHVLPHSRGGINCESNFVTACYGCQYGRGEWTIEEVELADPRSFDPVVDKWDGLSRLESTKLAIEAGSVN